MQKLILIILLMALSGGCASASPATPTLSGLTRGGSAPGISTLGGSTLSK